jgi:hypothetical protein
MLLKNSSEILTTKSAYNITCQHPINGMLVKLCQKDNNNDNDEDNNNASACSNNDDDTISIIILAAVCQMALLKLPPVIGTYHTNSLLRWEYLVILPKLLVTAL